MKPDALIFNAIWIIFTILAVILYNIMRPRVKWHGFILGVFSLATMYLVIIIFVMIIIQITSANAPGIFRQLAILNSLPLPDMSKLLSDKPTSTMEPNTSTPRPMKEFLSNALESIVLQDAMETPTVIREISYSAQDAFEFTYENIIKGASAEDYQTLHKALDYIRLDEGADVLFVMIDPYPINVRDFYFVIDNVMYVACLMAHYQRVDEPISDVYLYTYNLGGDLLRARLSGKQVKQAADMEIYASQKAVISFGCKHDICRNYPLQITPDANRKEAIAEATWQAKNGYFKGW